MANDEKSSRLASLWMFMSAFSASFGAWSFGCAVAWTSPAFLTLEREHINGLRLDPKSSDDDFIKSWVSSALTLGALFGCLASGFVIRFLGERKTLIAHNIPYLVGWAMVCYAHNFGVMIAGRAILGISVGMSCGTSSSYVANIATPSTRGMLGICFMLFVGFGQLSMNVFGLWLEWNNLCYVALFPLVLCAVGMFLAPDSPIELVDANKIDDAKQALLKLRKPSSDIKTELNELEDRVEASRRNNQNESTAALIVRADVYKPIMITVLLMLFQQFAGINAVMFYLSDILNNSSPSQAVNATLLTTTEASVESGATKIQLEALGVTVAPMLTVFFSGFLIDRLGRKMLLLISAIGHVLSLFVMGLYYYRREEWFEHASWLPVVCLIVFICSFAIGYGPIPWMIISELTPHDALSLVCSIGTASNWLFAFIVTKEFGDIQNSLHDYGSFWIFSGISLVSVIFTVFMVPETKNRTIEDMQRHFLGHK